MLTLGLLNSKETLDWILIEGSDLDGIQVRTRDKVTVPSGQRSSELLWFRLELLGLLDSHSPDLIGIRMAEQPSGAGSLSIGRVEVQGVLLAAAEEAGAKVKEVYGATIRAALGGSKNGVEAAITASTVLSALPKTRREPALAATAAMLKR